MRSVESSAKTMEEAVSLGLEKLGASLADVNIDILDEGSKGFLGILGGKPCVVRLTMREDADDGEMPSLSLDNNEEPKKPAKKPSVKEKAEKAKQSAKQKTEKSEMPAQGLQKTAPAKAEKPAAKVAPAEGADSPVAPAPMCEENTPEGKAQRFLLDVTRMMDVNVSVAARRDDEGNVRVDMHGDTLGILIGRRGETLDALQYLTSLYVNKGRDEYTRVTLDTENYRSKREEALTRLANRMANRAVKTGRKVVMEPMNPYERRILHSALQQNDAVTTHSEGEEPNRHVVITLK